MSALQGTAAAIRSGRQRKLLRSGVTVAIMLLALITIAAVSLMLGRTSYSPGEVLAVIFGETVPGASFTVGELRLLACSPAYLPVSRSGPRAPPSRPCFETRSRPRTSSV